MQGVAIVDMLHAIVFLLWRDSITSLSLFYWLFDGVGPGGVIFLVCIWRRAGYCKGCDVHYMVKVIGRWCSGWHIPFVTPPKSILHTAFLRYHLSTCCCDRANMFVFEYYRITWFSINADLPSHSIPLCLFTNQTECRLNVSGRVHRIQSFYSRNRAIGSSVCGSSVKWTLEVYGISMSMSTLQLLFETILPTNMHDWPMWYMSFVQLEFVIDLILFVRLYHHSYLDPAACKGVKLHLPRLLLVVKGSIFLRLWRIQVKHPFISDDQTYTVTIDMNPLANKRRGLTQNSWCIRLEFGGQAVKLRSFGTASKQFLYLFMGMTCYCLFFHWIWNDGCFFV